MKPPLLSIGLFVYNGEQFLPETLASFTAQTFTDYELIISDNGSTDRTQQICEAYAAADSRVRYYRSATNMGAGWNVRRVFSLATGKYFKWAACDDLLHPQFIETCIRALETDPGYVVAHSRTRVVNEAGEFLEEYNWPFETESPLAVSRFKEMLLNDHMCYQIFGVMRRDALSKVPPQGSYVNSDGVLLAQMAFLGRFYESPEFLFTSRRHDGQSCRTIPGRLKKRRFRLTNRFGTLPSPEWWDPIKAKKIGFPEWRQLCEYFKSVYNAPITTSERAQGFLLLFPWLIKHFRRMMKDLLIAADQVLYNFQMSQLRDSGWEEVKKNA